MPAQSTLSPDEKAKVKSVIPASSNKIFYAALARVYYAYPSPEKWSYAGLQGAMTFLHDKSKGCMCFKLVDVYGTRGVIWEHEFYQGMEYNPDRAFFHSFAGDSCMIGLVFADEFEAKTFWKKVMAKKDSKAGKASKKKNSSSAPKSPTKSSSKGGKIDKSLISGPTSGSFVHVAHMGYDENSGFVSKGVDPSWTAFLSNLESQGISKETIAENMDFIKDFTRQHQAQAQAKKPPAPPVSRSKSKPPPPPSR
ncbi:hypothetical protein DL96DRAFT_1420939, partial [Flagelloscypha sp. PMI_526]